MPWEPVQRIAYAVATYPFKAEQPEDLPLQVGDELYIIEQNGNWYRGYLQAAPSLLAGLTSSKGQVLEARIFTGIFPRICVEVRELLGEEDSASLRERLGEGYNEEETNGVNGGEQENIDPLDNLAVKPPRGLKKKTVVNGSPEKRRSKIKKKTSLAVVQQGPRDPNTPKPQAPVPMLKIGDETPTSASEPLVDEIASCLREWHDKNLHELLLSRKYPALENMSSLLQSLDYARRQILHKVLTKHELTRLREKTVWDLVRGNKAFNGEVIVRDPEQSGRLLTGEDSAVEVTKLQSMMSLLDERPHPAGAENLNHHHLLLDVKTFVGASTEPTTLVFFLASKTAKEAVTPLTESYVVDVPASGDLSDLAKQGNMRTLFADFASHDVGDSASANVELFLVVKVLSSQQVIVTKPGSRAGRDSGNPYQPSMVGSIGRSSGRRSLMWGNKSQSKYAKNSPISNKLDALNENTESTPESRDGPPKTAGSQRSRWTGAENKSPNSRTVQRTVGIGVLNVSPILKQDEEIEQVLSVWSPALGHNEKLEDVGEGWEEVIRELMTSKSGRFEKSRRAERLQIQLKPFIAPDAEALIKETPTLLSGVIPTPKMGFSGAPTKPRSDIYITIDEAYIPDRALLSRANGATPLHNSITCESLQITLEVRKASGERLEHAIYHTSDAKIGQTTWQSTVTGRGDSWRQTLKLAIPTADVPGCHLVMTLSDVPGSPFAISWMPLWDQQAFIRDGYHNLLLYRWDDSTNSPRGRGSPTGGYLKLPWSSRGKDDVNKDADITGAICNLRVQTYLCSTRLTQDKVLLGLLKWKEQQPTDVQDLLKRLTFVPEIEMVKLLPDVLDAIFSILVEKAGDDEFEDLIFMSLVTVLSIIHDRRFNLEPLIDQYADNQFNYPFACPCLVRSLTRLLANPSDPDTSRKLRATFKVVRQILKFISQARGQQVEKEAGIGITSGSPGFTRSLGSIFKALEGLMRNTAPILVGSQTLAAQHFHTWLPELTGLLSTEEIVHIAIDFMDSCALVKGKLILYKLVLIINYSKLDLFSQPEQRQALCMNTVRWIAPHWGKTDNYNEQWRDQVRLCCTILSTQVQNLANEIPDHIPKIIDSYLGLQEMPRSEKPRLSLLFPTTYPFPTKPISGPETKFDEALVELSAILSAVSNLPAGMQLELAEDDMANLLEDILAVHLSILQCDAFPADWLSVHIYHHKSTMKTLEYVANILLESFIPDPDDAENYHTELWKMFFTVLLKLVSSDALALETFTEQKRRAVWKIAGDIREDGADLLRRTWAAIGWDTSPDEKQRYGLVKMGGYQVQYVPGLVGSIVELCLSVHVGLRRVAVQVLQTMIVSEWTLSEDISVIQTEMIDCLAHIFKSKPLTESVLEKLFIIELLQLFDNIAQTSDPLYLAVQQLINTIDEYLDLLVAVYSSEPGEASHLHDRLRLMAFFKDFQKDSIYITYVHDLEKHHVNERQLTEAGLALRLHADLYFWDPKAIVPGLPSLGFPPQSQFDRKERLYFDMIKHFEDGKAWKSALAAYEELETQYRDNTFDLPKLARTERAIATIYEKISKSDRIVPHYFRVVFRGLGFPPSQRDKEYIYEGSTNEKLPFFMDRLLKQYPHAEFLTSGEVDSDAEGQHLIISSISPHRDFDHQVYQRARVPNVVRDYLLAANPSVFSVTTKRVTGGSVFNHTCEKVVYKIANDFPTMTRRSEIVSVEQIKYDALETALEKITRRTSELAIIERRVAEGDHALVSSLIDSLHITVNKESDNSMCRYRVLIPVTDNESDMEDPEAKPRKLTPLEDALQTALVDHAVLIKRCLTMFGKPENAELMGEVELENLTNRFEETYAIELSCNWAFPNHNRISAQSPTTPSGRFSNISQRYSSDSKRNSMLKMLAARNQPMPNTKNTFTTVDTSILEPGNTRSRNRLSSYFHRSVDHGHQRQQSENTAILAPVVNLSSTLPTMSEEGKNSLPRSSSYSTVRPQQRGRLQSDSGLSEDGSIPSEPKANDVNLDLAVKKRASFFGNSIGRARGRQGSTATEEGEDGGWFTQAGDGMRRSLSSRRDSESKDEIPEIKQVGGVRKRLSLLKLGKKNSKASVMAVTPLEEE